jgi:Plavaka transposase
LSYKNSRELNKIIDHQLPGRPRFSRDTVVVAGETYELYSRDIIACIKALYGNPEFAPHLVFAPERHYADDDKTIRLYHEMHTGKWWWETQVKTLFNLSFPDLT